MHMHQRYDIDDKTFCIANPYCKNSNIKYKIINWISKNSKSGTFISYNKIQKYDINAEHEIS